MKNCERKRTWKRVFGGGGGKKEAKVDEEGGVAVTYLFVAMGNVWLPQKDNGLIAKDKKKGGKKGEEWVDTDCSRQT